MKLLCAYLLFTENYPVQNYSAYDLSRVHACLDMTNDFEFLMSWTKPFCCKIMLSNNSYYIS